MPVPLKSKSGCSALLLRTREQLGIKQCCVVSEEQETNVEPSTGEEELATEAASSRHELSEREKERTAELKNGGRSGVTGQFGTLDLVEDSSTPELPKAPPAVADPPVQSPAEPEDGRVVTTDETGRRRTTVWPDGREKVEDTVTGKWVLKKPGRNGSMQEQHGGSKRPEENFVLVREDDGRYRLAERLDDRPSRRFPSFVRRLLRYYLAVRLPMSVHRWQVPAHDSRSSWLARPSM